MNVGKLREALKDLPDDMKVVLQADEEGNGFLQLRGQEKVVFIEEDAEAYSLDWTADDNCIEEDEWEELKQDKSKRAIVLFP